MQGIILIDKPSGFTSFDVVASLRRPLGTKRLGHTGTLDPIATGVLPILVGKATRLCSLLPENSKKYVASFKLGQRTDTYDCEGTVTEKSTKRAYEKEVSAALNGFFGETQQLPPMFSAVKINGVKLHKLARQGADIERSPRKITVYDIRLISFDEQNQCGSFSVFCSAGTYIRAIIDDLGQKLGTGAVMTALRRTESHGFKIDECLNLDYVRNNFDESMIIPIDRVLAPYPEVLVTDAQSVRFSNGGELDISRTSLSDGTTGFIRVKNRKGKLLGLGEALCGKIAVKCLFD